MACGDLLAGWGYLEFEQHYTSNSCSLRLTESLLQGGVVINVDPVESMTCFVNHPTVSSFWNAPRELQACQDWLIQFFEIFDERLVFFQFCRVEIPLVGGFFTKAVLMLNESSAN